MKRALLIALALLCQGASWPTPGPGLAPTGGGGGGGAACTLNSGNAYTSGTSVASISTAINGVGAGNNAVACLQRGQSWSESNGFAITTIHTGGTRVTICASTSGSGTCTTSGGANPAITITGQSNHCGAFTGGAAGYTIEDIDCIGPSNSDSWAWTIEKPSAHITFHGGHHSGFWQDTWTDSGSGAIVDDLVIGTCDRRVEISGNVSSVPSQNRSTHWGFVTNTTWSIWVHDFDGQWTGGQASQNHMIDLGSNSTSLAWSAAASDVTVECSTFDYTNTAHGMGSFLKFARGQRAIVRDSTFNVTSGACNDSSVIAFDVHNTGGTGVEGWKTASVYRNVFNTAECNGAVVATAAQDIDVYNNLGRFVADVNQRGLVWLRYQGINASPGGLQLQNIRAFNNTIYRSGSAADGYAMMWDNPGQDAWRDDCTGCAFFNNVIYELNATVSMIWSAINSGCAGYGTNGVNIYNNFVYSPNHAPTQIWSGCSAAANNSSTFSTDPSLVSPSTGNFHLVNSSSPPNGFGSATGAPSDDYDLVSRPSPPASGAFEVTP